MKIFFICLSFFTFIFLFTFVSCSKFEHKSLNVLRNQTVSFDITDKYGQFKQTREAGHIKKRNEFFVKSKITTNDDDKNENKVLEQLIVVSTPGTLSKKIKVMRPKISQYVVWLEGEKFFSELKVNEADRTLKVTMKSNEPEWNGVKKFDFPKGTGVFCFFAQIYECVAITGFFDKSLASEAGEMNFHIIWEGYPYFSEQYNDLTPKPFTHAKLKYDGKNADGEVRYTLTVDNQAIFYFLDKNKKFSKMFWVAQGLSMTRSEFQK